MTLLQALSMVPLKELEAELERRKNSLRDPIACKVAQIVAETFCVPFSAIVTPSKVPLHASARETAILALIEHHGYSGREASYALGLERDTPKRRRQRLAARIERNPRIGQLHAEAMTAASGTALRLTLNGAIQRFE